MGIRSLSFVLPGISCNSERAQGIVDEEDGGVMPNFRCIQEGGKTRA